MSDDATSTWGSTGGGTGLASAPADGPAEPTAVDGADLGDPVGPAETAARADDGATDAGLPLSVVVVTRNEEARIRQCLDSVFDACRQLPAYEVVLVDSNSSDDTVERAIDYPITVLQIPSDDLSTPAAGRYVGTHVASGEAILFVDGDMVLDEDWLPRALARLRGDPDVAAVDGWLNEARADEVRSVDSVRGVALYSAEALAAVGGFDPYLRSLEDVHLGFELAAAGYRLERLPCVAATHPESEPYPELFRRWRRGYTVGTGQTLRKSVTSPRLFVKHVVRMRYRFALLGWLGAGLVAVHRRSTRAAWLGLAVAAFAVVASERGIGGAITFCVQKAIALAGTVVGLRFRARSPDTYPLEAVELVERASAADR